MSISWAARIASLVGFRNTGVGEVPNAPKASKLVSMKLRASAHAAAENMPPQTGTGNQLAPKRAVSIPASRPRLPEGQKLTTGWPVLDLGTIPSVDRDSMSLEVTGEVSSPLTLRWVDLMAMPQVQSTSDIHCVTGWSRYDNNWTGISASVLASLAGVPQNVSHVLLHAHDGYTTNVRMKLFMESSCLLAHSWNGLPLTQAHGGPLRLVLPSLYFWKSAKWLSRVEFITTDQYGFWEERGYHANGDPWKEQRYAPSGSR